VVINILLKALTAEPFPDFNLCISLLDDRLPNANTDEPDPLPTLLPILTNLHDLLHQCRFPAFWTFYRSEELESLRENYTIECIGFEDAIREVAARAVKATFTRIGLERLGPYVDLAGTELVAWATKQGWAIGGQVVSIPPNPDNQIESVIIRENVTLPREWFLLPKCIISPVLQNYRRLLHTLCKQSSCIMHLLCPMYLIKIVCAGWPPSQHKFYRVNNICFLNPSLLYLNLQSRTNHNLTSSKTRRMCPTPPSRWKHPVELHRTIDTVQSSQFLRKPGQ